MKTANRVTGIQTAQQGLRVQLETWREQLSPREYATLIDVLGRMVEHERVRSARWLRRVA